MEKAELCRLLTMALFQAHAQTWVCISVPTVLVKHTQNPLQILLLLLIGWDFGNVFKFLGTLPFCVSWDDTQGHCSSYLGVGWWYEPDT